MNGVFKFNAHFASKKTAINLNAPLKNDAASNQVDKISKTIEQDRDSLLQAAMVRILKAKKMLTTLSLTEEVTRYLSSKFIPQTNDIDKSILTLIERDFIERSSQDNDILLYVA